MRDFWVFGYGSLMWRPGFDHEEIRHATLHGAHRALCVISHVHRGTRERPGLVLGLDRGGACRGMAFRVAGAKRNQVMDYLRAREQVTRIYIECERPIRLYPDGRTVPAVCYMVDRSHEQYGGVLSLADQVRLVRQGVGQSGANPEYVLNTLQHLREMGIRDSRLEALGAALSETG